MRPQPSEERIVEQPVKQAEVKKPEPKKAEAKKPATRKPEPKKKAKEQPKKKEARKPAPAPSKASQKAQANAAKPAPKAAALQSSSGSKATISPARWQSKRSAHLERRKKYPSGVRKGLRSTAQVRFQVDASGNMPSVSLTRSSGEAALDKAAVSLVRGASPVSAPPPGANRTVVVPINSR